MKVSVIICAYSFERFDDLQEGIESILNQTYKDVELIISVDHNDELLAELQSLSQTKNVMFSKNKGVRGLSDTRNAGIRKAQGDIIAFIDDDAVADKKWVEYLVQNYADENIMAVGGRIIPMWEEDRPWWFPEEFNWIVGCSYKGLPEVKCEMNNLIGCNMSFRSIVFEEVEGFSTSVGRVGKNALGGEETELCLKIKANIENAKIIYEPTALVYHKVPISRCNINYLFRRAYGQGLSRARITNMLKKNSTLSFETKYLAYLLTKTIPNFMKKILTLRRPVVNICELLLVISVCLTTGFGYVYYKLYFMFFS